MPAYKIKLPYPENLLHDIFGDGCINISIAPDFDATMKFILKKHMQDRDISIILMRYRDKQTKKYIAQYFHVSTARIAEIINKAINLLKLSDDIIKFGLAKYTLNGGLTINSTINELNLSIRAYNSLYQSGIRQVKDITTLSRRELLDIYNLGYVSANEIINTLAEKGYYLKGSTGYAA